MRSRGCDYVPQPIGLTDETEVVSFLPGQVYNDRLPDLFDSEETIVSAARLLRAFHDASRGYLARLTGREAWMLPARSGEGREVMCHGDFAPYNVVIQNGLAVGIVDFDTLRPGSRLWDVTYAVYRWTRLMDLDDRAVRQARLFLDSYGLENKDHQRFCTALIERLQALCDYMEKEARAGNIDFQLNIERGDLALYLADIERIKQNCALLTEDLL